MAPSHVPADHLPLQGQNLYADSATYQNLYSSVDQQFSSTPSWDAQLGHHPGLVSNTPPPNQQQSWHHSSFPQQQAYTSISQQPSYANQNQTHGYQNASPYQYGQFGQHGSALGSYTSHTANVDPALSLDPSALRQQQQSPYQLAVQNPPPPHTHSGSVTPQPPQQQQQQQLQQPPQQLQLQQQQQQQQQQQKQNVAQQQAIQQQQQQQHQKSQPAPQQNTRPVAASPYQIPKTTTELFAQRAAPAVLAKPVSNPEYEIPKGRKSGGLYILDQAALAKATKSIALNKLVTFGSEPIHLATNRTALPLYTPRQSVKDLKKLGADNKKIAKKSASSKSAQSKAPKAEKALKREVSDSESYTESSDDDSEYTDDEDDEPSPLPNIRPEEPHEAVRYDIIKATWLARKSQPSSEKIKACLRDFWEVLNTIQKRWRADSKAVTEAEEQKKTGELPVLKSRVTSQRDLLQSALKSALDFAHPDVLHHLGQVKPFLYLCYQFLANRFKMRDYDGALPSVIYEILAKCAGTLTSELLEETKVIKALNSMKKNANEKNKAFIQQIIDGAASGSKKTKAGSPMEAADSADGKNTKRPAAQPAGRTVGDGPAAKKVKPAEAALNATKKDGITALASKPATAGSPPQKRVGEKITAAPVAVKARGNQVVNKPSGIFASLNAASKKPTPAMGVSTTAKSGTQQKPTAAAAAKDKKPTSAPSKPAFSFAETMASLLKPKEEEAPAPTKAEKQLPPETEEEKKKRLRKESRRHLRVTFRPDVSLVSIRYFHHDPEEEIGHDENFVRDAGDIGGEGRMFKQHKELDVDEDEDELEIEYRPWAEPSQVDFSTVDPEERKRNYEPYGGGECKPSCPEKEANELHEQSTLMVFYSHPRDIPNSPREPLEQQLQQSPAVTVVNFGPPPDIVQKRSPKPPTPAPAAPDFSNLESIIKQFSSQPAAAPAPQPTVAQNTYVPPPVPAPAPAPVPDISSILSALQGQNGAQPHVPVPTPAPAPVPPAQPAFDLNAIMSAMSALQSGGGASLPPPPPGFPPFPFPFALPQQQQSQQQQPPPQDNSGTYSPPPAQVPSSQHTNGGTKRQRDDGHNNNERGHGSSKRQRNRGEKPHKVLACKFFQIGKCNKGDNCTYIHDVNM